MLGWGFLRLFLRLQLVSLSMGVQSSRLEKHERLMLGHVGIYPRKRHALCHAVLGYARNQWLNTLYQAVCALWLRCIMVLKQKNKSFTSCRSRVNISGSSKIAWIIVEFNGNSLSVAIPSKVKKCLRACCVNNIKFASYLTGNRPLTCKRIPKRQRPSNTRTIFHVIHLKAWIRDWRKEKPNTP